MASTQHNFPSLELNTIEYFQENCTNLTLKNVFGVARLYLEKKVTIEEINNLNEYQTLLLSFRGIQQQVLEECVSLEELKYFRSLGQNGTVDNLGKFFTQYNDKVSWFVDESNIKTLSPAPDAKEIFVDRFPPEFVKLFISAEGCCGSLSALFLASLVKDLILSTVESKDEKEITPPTPNINQYYSDLKTIIEWNGTNILTQEQITIFRTLAYKIYQFKYGTVEYNQTGLEKILFSNDENFTFSHEKTYIITANQFELEKKLALLNQINRLTYIMFNKHVVAKFNNVYFDPNDPGGHSIHDNDREMAAAIHFSANTTATKDGKEDKDVTKKHLFSFVQFRHCDTPVCDYPSAAMVLEDCADPSVLEYRNNATALHRAAANNAVDCLKIYLAKENCDINAKDIQGRPALHAAIFFNNIDIIQELLEHKDCDVSQSLIFAAERGNYLAIQTLLNRRDDFHPREIEAALGIATKSKRFDITKILSVVLDCINLPLLSTAEDVGWTPLMQAVENDSLEEVRAILESKNCDLNATTGKLGLTALMLAAKSGKADMVDAMLEHKSCNVNLATHLSDITPLRYAIENGFIEIARKLIAAGADLEKISQVFAKLFFNREASTLLETLLKQKISNLNNAVIKEYLLLKLLTEAEASALSPEQINLVEQLSHSTHLPPKLIPIIVNYTGSVTFFSVVKTPPKLISSAASKAMSEEEIAFRAAEDAAEQPIKGCCFGDRAKNKRSCTIQ